MMNGLSAPCDLLHDTSADSLGPNLPPPEIENGVDVRNSPRRGCLACMAVCGLVWEHSCRPEDLEAIYWDTTVTQDRYETIEIGRSAVITLSLHNN